MSKRTDLCEGIRYVDIYAEELGLVYRTLMVNLAHPLLVIEIPRYLPT